MRERIDHYWSQRDIFSRVVIVSTIALLHTPLLYWLRNLWRNSSIDEIVLSVAMPVTIAGLLYLRRAELKALQTPSRTRYISGLVLLSIGVCLALLSIAYSVTTPLALSAPISLHGYLLWTREKQKVKSIVIPIYLVVFLVPGTYGDLSNLSIYLQYASAATATELLQLVGYPSFLDGFVIVTSGTYNHVTEACSGMVTLTTLIVYGMVFSFLFKLNGKNILKNLLFILSLALMVNSVRIAFISYLLVEYGEAVANGPLHDGGGVTLFAIAYAIMFLFVRRCAKQQPC